MPDLLYVGMKQLKRIPIEQQIEAIKNTQTAHFYSHLTPAFSVITVLMYLFDKPDWCSFGLGAIGGLCHGENCLSITLKDALTMRVLNTAATSFTLIILYWTLMILLTYVRWGEYLTPYFYKLFQSNKHKEHV
jgi:hypothetical protein